MFPYILVLGFLVFFSVFEICNYDKNGENIRWVFALILLFLFSGLRYDVGKDFQAYEELYNSSLLGLNPEIKELGWAFFFHLFRSLNIPFQIVVLIISFLTIYCVAIFIRQYSPYPFFSLLIFFCFAQYYTYTFNVMRQCLASYIFFASLEHIENRNFIKYFLNIGCSIFFIHFSAIICLPLYFILRRSYPLSVKLGLLVVILYVAQFFILIVASLDAYKIYLNFEQFASEITITTYMLMLLSTGLLILDIFLGKTYKTVTYNILQNINYVALVFLSITCFFAETPLTLVFLRFACFYTPILIVLIPKFIKYFFSLNSQRIVIACISMAYIAIFFHTLHSGGEVNKLLPYRSIL